jgi:hypothetical protein
MIRHSLSPSAGHTRPKAQVTEYKDPVRECQAAEISRKEAQKARNPAFFCAFCASLWQHVSEGES